MNKLLFMRFHIRSWSLKKLHLYKLNSDWFWVKSCCFGSGMMMMLCEGHVIDFGKHFCSFSRMYLMNCLCLLHILGESKAACLQH
jgi:bacteriorhodopsin